MELIEDLTDQGVKIELTGEDLKNRLAWLAFEQVAWTMAQDDLGIGF